MKIGIAYDGSEASHVVLDDLRWAGLPPHGEALLMMVADVWLPPEEVEGEDGSMPHPSGRVQETIQRSRLKALNALAEAQTTAERIADALHASLPGWTVQGVGLAGAPAWALLHRAEIWKPDLLCMGTHGLSAWSGLLLGSVSQRLLAESKTSVRVARPRCTRPKEPLHLLVGVDGSTGSEAAVRAILDRTWPAGTEVAVVTVLDPALEETLLGEDWEGEEGEEIFEARSQALCEKTVERLQSGGLKASPYVFTGDARREILDLAEQWPADSVFVGAVGLRGQTHLGLGSVPLLVATSASCSVEVVRAAGTEAVP